MKKIKVKKGDVYGRLTIMEEVETHKLHRMFKCKCVCGDIKNYYLVNLRRGYTSSCGCRNVEVLVERSKTHGLSKTPVYWAWSHIHQRCYNKKDKRYKDYGGRGIKVCKRWGDFDNFLKDMGFPPLGKTIDRIDNNKDYCKSNCRWATKEEQSNNTRRNRIVYYKGNKLTLANAVRDLSVLKYYTVKQRLDRGWSVEKALKEPLKN